MESSGEGDEENNYSNPCRDRTESEASMVAVKNIGLLTAIVFVVIVAVGSAGAQATRTWVSGVGDDANPCSRTAPCKTFAGAISKTAAVPEALSSAPL